MSVVAGGAATWTAPPYCSAPTPYSLVVADQYELAPSFCANDSTDAASGSSPKVTTTTFGLASTPPPELVSVGAAG